MGKPRKMQGNDHKYRSKDQCIKVVRQIQVLKRNLEKIYQAIDNTGEWSTVNIGKIRVEKIWKARPQKAIDQLDYMKKITDEANMELAVILSEREAAQASASSTLQDFDLAEVSEGFWDPAPTGTIANAAASSESNPADTTIESRAFEPESAATTVVATANLSTHQQ